MKKLFFAFLALLLGFGLTWGQPHEVTIHGSITAPAGLPSDLKIWVGTAGDSPTELQQISLPANTYSFTATVNPGSNVYFNLGYDNNWALYPSGDEYRSQDYFFETSDGQKNRHYLRLEDWDNPLATEPEGGWYDYTFHLTIVAKGGGAKASLVGKVVDESTNCLMEATVEISGGDYSAQTSTQYMDYDKYYSKLNCAYGYEFKDLEVGTEYTLTYSKYNYITQTQTITITEAGETMAPSVTLAAKPVEYIFEGVLKYVDADNTERKVESAKITAYDGYGEDAQVLATTYTDARGQWLMSLECKANATIYFDAEHPDIVVTQRAAGYAVFQSGNQVNIQCLEYVLPLLGPETYKLKQLESEDGLRVELSWTWPQELIDNYNTAPDEGIYRITAIRILRPAKVKMADGTEPWADGTLVGEIQPAEYALPATSFLDGVAHELILNKEFTYSMEVVYSKPALGTVQVPNDEFLTINLASTPVKIDSVVLTLNVNDPAMGTVTGAGKYEKNTMVPVQAQANPGYRFVAWKEGDNTVAATAKYTVTLTENKELTAVFEARPVVLDSVFLAIDVNNAEWGSVQGAGKYAKGEEVTVKAVANAGYVFKQWKSGNTVLSSKAQYTFVLNTDSTITAIFGREAKYRGMTDCSAKQIQGGDSPAVRLSWQWPEELIQDYVTATGEGVYEISMVTVTRLEYGAALGNALQTFRIIPKDYTVPPTTFVDSQLMVSKTYTYSFEVEYIQPTYKSISVDDHANLTVTIVSSPEAIEWTDLVLLMADSSMGTVTGTGQYEKNDSATILATPKVGYAFKAWMEGNDTLARTARHRIKMTEDRTITALFKMDSVTLTLLLNDTAMGTVTGAGKYRKGESVTIAANAQKGYKFESWRENGNPVSTKASYTINSLATDRTLTAVFVPSVDSVTLTLETDGNGTVEGAGKYALNKEVTIKATPNPGYVFSAWKTEQGVVSRSAEYTFTLSRNITLTAEFAVQRDSATLTLTPNDSEMGYVSGAGRYVKGAEVTITATPRAGHGFEAWKADETVIATTRTHTFRLNGDSALRAVFYAYPDSVDLTLLVNDPAMGTVQGAGRYPKNGEVTVRAIAKEGYSFKAWQANDANVSLSAEYTFMLDEDLTLTAVFIAQSVADDSITLTLKVNDDRMGMVQGAGRYEKGAEVTIKAIAHAGYEFVAWMDGGEIVTKTAEYKLVLNGDMTLTSLFVEETANEGNEQAAWSVSAENGQLILRSNDACRYEVYTVSGTLLEQVRGNGGECRIAVNNSGLYLIRRTSSTGISVKKVMVH